MAKRPFSARIKPKDELILVRIPEILTAKSSILVPVTDDDGNKKIVAADAAEKAAMAIVVEVGPGPRSPMTGERQPIDPDIKAGATIVFREAAFRPKALHREMAEECLWFLAEVQVVCVVAEVASHVREPHAITA